VQGLWLQQRMFSPDRDQHDIVLAVD